MTVQLIREGKREARRRKASPTGEKHKHTCRLRLILEMKKSNMGSLASAIPSPLPSLRTEL